MSDPARRLRAAWTAARAVVLSTVLSTVLSIALSAASTASAAAEAAEDIRDIRGPKYLFPPWLLPAVIAGAVLFVLGAYGIWRWLRRRRQPRPSPPRP